VAVLTLVCGLALFPGTAHAANVCYAWSIFPAERWVINVSSGTGLGPGQTVYVVRGKYVGGGGPGTIAAVTGALLKNTSTTNPPIGTHLSMTGLFVRGGAAGIANETIFPVTIDCTSSSTAVPPPSLFCKSRNEFPVYHGPSILTAVPFNGACLIFQDGGSLEPSGEVPAEGAGGLAH